MFVRKRIEDNEIAKYKTRLVAQGLSQRLHINYKETHSPMVYVIILRFLTGLVV